MDFSRLHTYTPPQCLPENTGYTYALSSSYSSSALDFETENKIDPVFDSPRMARCSLRFATSGLSDDARNYGHHDSSYAGNVSLRQQSPQMAKQRKSKNKQSVGVRHTPRRNLTSSSIVSQSSFNSHATDTTTVLDETLVQEQTAVDAFWGLDEGDPEGHFTTVMQGNGDSATTEMQTAMQINGYTCGDCSILSERREVLTAYSPSHIPSSRIYSRDRSQKHAYRGTYFYMSKILQLVKHAAASFTSLLMQLFQMVLLKLGYDFKAHSDYCGSVNVKEFYREDSHFDVNEESICYLMLHVLQTVGATGWLVSQKMVSLLWLAILSPGRAASRMFGLLRAGWYQLVTLMSSCKMLPLRRCLPSIFELILFLIPLLFLLGIWFWWFDGFISLLPSLNWTRIGKIQIIDYTSCAPKPQADSFQSVKPPKTDSLALHKEHELRILALEDLLGRLSAEYRDIQKELDIAKVKTMRDADELLIHQLRTKVTKLELELSQMKLEQLTEESMKTSCKNIYDNDIHDKVNAQVKESVKLMIFGHQQEDLPKPFLQWLKSSFVSKSDLQTLLQDLELQILRNITVHMSAANQKLTPEIVTNAMANAGISGVTEAQVQNIVNNALKLYSQDKIGMVDFALESGGGSILSTRCSETHESKTALITLFGVPIVHTFQSPRVVIQPDTYPGNCWAFKGSLGYLVIKLSMKIYPTAFTVEHAPKALLPAGDISSAPRNFSVYGLDHEDQEEGRLLGQYVYDQGGPPLQMFPSMEKSEKAYEIVELRILSNWGNAEYTCLYRFRVHGKIAE